MKGTVILSLLLSWVKSRNDSVHLTTWQTVYLTSFIHFHNGENTWDRDFRYYYLQSNVFWIIGSPRIPHVPLICIIRHIYPRTLSFSCNPFLFPLGLFPTWNHLILFNNRTLLFCRHFFFKVSILIYQYIFLFEQPILSLTIPSFTFKRGKVSIDENYQVS